MTGHKKIGHLIMAANSLGRDEDVPSRSLEALRKADLLIFEEDRGARRALKAAGITRSYAKLSEHREQGVLDEAEAALRAGNTVCYMSDQGMPVIADPGRELVALAHLLKARLTIIPGPSSITTALSACPFPITSFRYVGFPERETGRRDAQLRRWTTNNEALVILDTPYRLEALIDACGRAFGANRRAVLAIDISGEKEGFFYDSLQGLKATLKNSERLNFVLIIAPPS